MILFISPTRRRALKVRNRLMKERIEIATDKLSVISSPERSKLIIRDRDIKAIINILDEILYGKS
jgi:hypothetical protein